MAKEALVLWLEEKLNLERATIREQHRLQHAMMQERHLQLLEDMANLHGVSLHQSPDSCNIQPLRLCDTLPFETQQDSKQASAEAIAPLPILPQDKDSGGIEVLETASTMHSKKKTYKTRALQYLARQKYSVELEGASLLKRIVKSHAFELVSALGITINGLTMAMEIEYSSFDSGHSVGYKGYSPSEDVWPGADLWFGYLDAIFVCLFTVELLLRVGADGSSAFKSRWIWFDTVIVSASAVTCFFLSSSGSRYLDQSHLRVARIVRIALAFKMIRVIRGFDTLYLLMRSLTASVSTLCWSFMFMLAVTTALGMCLSQVLRPYIQNDAHKVAERLEVFLYFGTFSRSMVTMFEITLGNCWPSCRIMMNNVSEWFGLFYVLYNCCFAFALIRVIQAVFIAETTRVVAADDQIAISRKERDRELYLGKLRTFFDELDEDDDGLISHEELRSVTDDPLLKGMMSTLEIGLYDLEALFEILAQGDDTINIDEFIKGLPRVKGSAQSLDLVSVLALTQKLDLKIDSILEMIQSDSILGKIQLGFPETSPCRGTKLTL